VVFPLPITPVMPIISGVFIIKPFLTSPKGRKKKNIIFYILNIAKNLIKIPPSGG
jgi:hypothetical protein